MARVCRCVANAPFCVDDGDDDDAQKIPHTLSHTRTEFVPSTLAARPRAVRAHRLMIMRTRTRARVHT